MPLALRSPVLGVVSHGLPPGTGGFHYMLQALLEPIPKEKLALVGVFPRGERWRGSASFPTGLRRVPGGRAESMAAAIALVGLRATAPPLLRRRFPNVRRIFATLDPTMGVASAWARVAEAELWVYGIDLHASGFWGAGSFLRETMHAWRAEALGRATRTFALSHRMAEWMVAHGAREPVEVLPPLLDVGMASPLPGGPPTFLYSGWVYGANARPLKWLERAVADVAPDARLRLLTNATVESIRAQGLDVRRWSVGSVPSAEVPREVARATWGVIALDPGFADRESLKVAWPTKLREYLATGRPVLMIAGADYAAAEIARDGGWGLVATSEEETRQAVREAVAQSPAELLRRGAAAHAYARAHTDNATVGARWRDEALAPYACGRRGC